MTTALLIVIVLIFVLLMGKLVGLLSFRRQVAQLFARSPQITGKAFRMSDYPGVPEPVRRYFLTVLPEGRPFVSTARVLHGGRFKTGPDAAWTNISGQEYFTVARPGFIWRGQTRLFSAIDKYVGGNGRLSVYLFSAFRMAGAGGSGKRFSEGELQRWLAEAVWFPTALLSHRNLEWRPIDASRAELIYRYRRMTLHFTVTFDENGMISAFETNRYLNGDDLEKWIGRPSAYRLMSGVLVPTRMQASWLLAAGELTYADFEVSHVDYDHAVAFGPDPSAARIPAALGAVLSLATAISATLSGVSMLLDPTGKALGLATQMLHRGIFADFRIPGWTLLLVGVTGFSAAGLALAKQRLHPAALLLHGLLLLGWMAVQIYVVGMASWLQPVMLCVALLVAGTGLRIASGPPSAAG